MAIAFFVVAVGSLGNHTETYWKPIGNLTETYQVLQLVVVVACYYIVVVVDYE